MGLAHSRKFFRVCRDIVICAKVKLEEATFSARYLAHQLLRPVGPQDVNDFAKKLSCLDVMPALGETVSKFLSES